MHEEGVKMINKIEPVSHTYTTRSYIIDAICDLRPTLLLYYS